MFVLQGVQQEQGQRVVVTPDQAFPLHRLLLTLHAGSQIQPGQILWCSQRTSDTDLSSFLQRVEHHRCVCCTTANMAVFISVSAALQAVPLKTQLTCALQPLQCLT